MFILVLVGGLSDVVCGQKFFFVALSLLGLGIGIELVSLSFICGEEKLKNIEGAQALPENATYADQIKYELCKYIVLYIRTQRITQSELAQKLNIDPARISEIVHYKIDKFTLDKLVTYYEKLNPNLSVKVA